MSRASRALASRKLSKGSWVVSIRGEGEIDIIDIHVDLCSRCKEDLVGVYKCIYTLSVIPHLGTLVDLGTLFIHDHNQPTLLLTQSSPI